MPHFDKLFSVLELVQCAGYCQHYYDSDTTKTQSYCTYYESDGWDLVIKTSSCLPVLSVVFVVILQCI